MAESAQKTKIFISHSFMSGYIRALDLGGTKNWPLISDNRKRDFEALRSDWGHVGDCIRREERNYSESKEGCFAASKR